MVNDRDGAQRDGATSGRSGGRKTLKKGPWTTAEDAILVEYVKRHGEGNWNAVQRNSGLLRCGKSCRLRWANHLRPHLKKGAFSPEEERLIIELHAKLGNKWARMASQLPGRTDNEIKNYWNTRLKRRQRAGLPIYPPDIEQNQHQQEQPNSSTSSLSSLFSSSSTQCSKLNFSTPSLSPFDPINFSTTVKPLQRHHNSSFLTYPNHHLKLFQVGENNGSFALPLSSFVSPFSSSSSTLFNQSLPIDLLPQPSLQYNSGQFGMINTQPPSMGASFDLIDLVTGTERELPSIQSPVPVTTPSSSDNTGGDYMMAASSNADEYEIAPELSLANSGLLEALLEESQALTRAQKSSTADKVKEKCVVEYGSNEGAGDTGGHVESVFRDGGATIENQWVNSSSVHSSIGMKAKDPVEEMNSEDDDLSSLLDNFPLMVPVPDWNDGSGNTLNNMNEANAGFDNQQEALRPPVATTLARENHDWTLGACCWNNMPGIS
ncbi:hypothetical protein F0562_011062 [Nyssa sinensis]|uniref:Transcription factor n=1 Tax=Nyssa sinensis TaxID=561372 RepID=A0A5J5A2W0_9ASTE|nr:hypothetical protein F0562_011062 [Nyssa sinensis]